MKGITLDTAEALALKMRASLRLSESEPVNLKTVLRLQGIIALYRPLSDTLYGLSMKSSDGKCRFILINSNTTRGRQHFTVAHELYHLYYDENPHPHFCREGMLDESERSANAFARAFLMPKAALVQLMSPSDLAAKNVDLSTLFSMEALFGVSHSALLVRLKELKFISKECYDRSLNIRVSAEAHLRGYDTELYKPGNEGLVIGDFGAKARELYDREIISEGHYVELLNMIGYGRGEGEDSSGC